MTRGAATRTLVSRHVVLMESGGDRTSYESGGRQHPRGRPAHALAASWRPLLQLIAAASQSDKALRRRGHTELWSASTDRHRTLNQHCIGPSCSADLRSDRVAVRGRGVLRAFAERELVFSQKLTLRT